MADMHGRQARVVLSPRQYGAVLFDLDGVLTRTARLHAAAWKQVFDRFLAERAERTGEPYHPFTQEDYRRYVDGRPRLEGVRTFLDSRRLLLPEGSQADGAEQESVHGLGRRKTACYLEALRTQGAQVDPAAAQLVARLRAAGVRTAVVTASRNCTQVLRAAGLGGAFDVQVDGVEAARLGLAGKPRPDTFVEAARRLGVEPARAVVLEDALAGVEAARRGGFGLVIGVRRADPPGALLAAGAHVEVEHLGELAVEQAGLAEGPLLAGLEPGGTQGGLP